VLELDNLVIDGDEFDDTDLCNKRRRRPVIKAKGIMPTDEIKNTDTVVSNVVFEYEYICKTSSTGNTQHWLRTLKANRNPSIIEYDEEDISESIEKTTRYPHEQLAKRIVRVQQMRQTNKQKQSKSVSFSPTVTTRRVKTASDLITDEELDAIIQGKTIQDMYIDTVETMQPTATQLAAECTTITDNQATPEKTTSMATQMMDEAIHKLTTPTPGSILTNLEVTVLNMVQAQMHKLIAKLQATIPENHKAPNQAQQ
jgi:hypothetical protein